jgi:hypothetical protein
MLIKLILLSVVPWDPIVVIDNCRNSIYIH